MVNRFGLEFSKFRFLTIPNVNNCARNKWSISCGKSRQESIVAAAQRKEVFHASDITLLCAASGKRGVDYFAIYILSKFYSGYH